MNLCNLQPALMLHSQTNSNCLVLIPRVLCVTAEMGLVLWLSGEESKPVLVYTLQPALMLHSQTNSDTQGAVCDCRESSLAQW